VIINKKHTRENGKRDYKLGLYSIDRLKMKENIKQKNSSAPIVKTIATEEFLSLNAFYELFGSTTK
jgi:hypothetical protein